MNTFSMLQYGRLRLPNQWRRLGILLALLIGWIADPRALGQGTTISYQGQLTRAGAPAEGTYDLQFALYPSLKDGAALGSTVTLPAVSVNGGRFTVDLDFGAGAFNGSPRWLEIAVRPASSGSYSILSPRQALNAVPYALYAMTPAGPPGATGNKGDKGEKGDKGDPGSIGPEGEPGPSRLSDTDLFLRKAGDTYHGMGWYGVGRPFGSETPDGPVIYGFGGGALGSQNEAGSQLALQWTRQATVAIGPGTRPASAPLHVAAEGGSGDQFILGSPRLETGDTTLVMGLTAAKNGGSYLQAIAETGVAYGNLLVNPDGGRVGILTRTPTAELEVNGTVKAKQFEGDGAGLVNVPGTARTVVSVTAFGSNGYNQTDVPTDLGEVIAISAARFYSVALKKDGTIVGWGDNQYGQITVPKDLKEVVAISAGGRHMAALKQDGTVAVWGDNQFDQLYVPPDLATVTAISSGGAHTLALKNDGTVVAWGANASNQSKVPTNLSGVVAVAAGGGHSLALKSDGTIVAWGSNSHGQIIVPNDLTGVIALACGDVHSVALKGDGTVVVWGGYELTHEKDVPQGLEGVVALSAAGSLTVALKRDGTVVAWGGQLHNPEVEVPPGLHSVTAIAAGSYHVLTLRKTQVFAGQLNVTGSLTATAFKTTSDRNAKENFASVDPLEILNKVAVLPITHWNFKGEGGERHVGPMAQDFHSTFGLGNDERHIATVDADGIALAAIQGLNSKVEQLDSRNRKLDERNRELEKRNRDLIQTLQHVERRLVELESKAFSSPSQMAPPDTAEIPDRR